jgi:amino-acid N-acetyltransferase
MSAPLHHASIEPGSLAEVRGLLATSGLPTADLHDPAIELLGAWDGAALVGAVGLQRCGDAGLVRSLAVAAAWQGRGLGRELCARVLTLARGRGLTALYLLTTTAADFFRRLGYRDAPRDEVPAAIRATAEFASLCPSTATVLRLDLSA